MLSRVCRRRIGDLLRTCATLPVDLRSHRHVLCQLLTYRHSDRISHFAMPIVASLARATLLEAVRDRLLWLAVVVVVIAFGLAQFLNQVAITESREIQTALLAAALRVAAVFILAVFVITSMVRELGDKVTELLLSLPAPRAAQRAAVGAVRKFPRTCPLDHFPHLRAADRDGDEPVLRAVLRAGGPRVCRRCGLLPAVAFHGGDADHSRRAAAGPDPHRSRGECRRRADRAPLAGARRHDADDLAAGAGTGREHSRLGRRPDRTLPRADLFRGAFRLVPQEFLRRCHNDRLRPFLL